MFFVQGTCFSRAIPVVCLNPPYHPVVATACFSAAQRVDPCEGTIGASEVPDWTALPRHFQRFAWHRLRGAALLRPLAAGVAGLRNMVRRLERIRKRSVRDVTCSF